MGTSHDATCPHLVRLEKAKVCYRAQQAELARLRDRLGRYQRIGLRRFRQGEAVSLAWVGTELFYANQTLERAVEQRDLRIHELTKLIAVLKMLLWPDAPPCEL